MPFSSLSTSAEASPPLTPEVVEQLKINAIKAAFPVNEMPDPEQQFTDQQPFEWELDGPWYASFFD